MRRLELWHQCNLPIMFLSNPMAIVWGVLFRRERLSIKARFSRQRGFALFAAACSGASSDSDRSDIRKSRFGPASRSQMLHAGVRTGSYKVSGAQSGAVRCEIIGEPCDEFDDVAGGIAAFAADDGAAIDDEADASAVE